MLTLSRLRMFMLFINLSFCFINIFLFQLEYMDLDEFLLENNIDDDVVKRTLSEGPSFSSSGGSSQGSPSSFSHLPSCLASPAFRPFPLESPSGTQGGGASPFCENGPGPDSTASPLSSLCPESPADNPDSPYLVDDSKFLLFFMSYIFSF